MQSTKILSNEMSEYLRKDVESPVPWLILSSAHVAFEKVMLKLKEQLQIVSYLLLQ